MNVGDLVKYAASDSNHVGVGVIVEIKYTSLSDYSVTVLWSDGNTHTHSGQWLIPLKEKK